MYSQARLTAWPVEEPPLTLNDLRPSVNAPNILQSRAGLIISLPPQTRPAATAKDPARPERRPDKPCTHHLVAALSFDVEGARADLRFSHLHPSLSRTCASASWTWLPSTSLLRDHARLCTTSPSQTIIGQALVLFFNASSTTNQPRTPNNCRCR